MSRVHDVTEACTTFHPSWPQQVGPRNLDVWRNWSCARDYVTAMQRMPHHLTRSDYLVESGIRRSDWGLVDSVFRLADRDCCDHVTLNLESFWPAETVEHLADPGKQTQELGWYPPATVEAILPEMLESDLRSNGVNPDEYIGAAPIVQASSLWREDRLARFVSADERSRRERRMATSGASAVDVPDSEPQARRTSPPLNVDAASLPTVALTASATSCPGPAQAQTRSWL